MCTFSTHVLATWDLLKPHRTRVTTKAGFSKFNLEHGRTWNPWTRSFPLFRVPFLKNPPRQCGPRTTQLFQDTKKTFNNGTFMNIRKHWLMDEMLGRHRHDTTKPLTIEPGVLRPGEILQFRNPLYFILSKKCYWDMRKGTSRPDWGTICIHLYIYSFILRFYVHVFSGLTLSTVTNICSAAFVAPTPWVLEDRLTSSKVGSISAFPLRFSTYKHEQRIQRIQRSRVHVEVDLKKTLRTLKATEFPWTFEIFFFRTSAPIKIISFSVQLCLEYWIMQSGDLDLRFAICICLAKWNTSGTRRVHVFKENILTTSRHKHHMTLMYYSAYLYLFTEGPQIHKSEVWKEHVGRVQRQELARPSTQHIFF